jgi:hypothetical protein
MSGSHLLDFEFPSTLSWVLLIMVSKTYVTGDLSLHHILYRLLSKLRQ